MPYSNERDRLLSRKSRYIERYDANTYLQSPVFYRNILTMNVERIPNIAAIVLCFWLVSIYLLVINVSSKVKHIYSASQVVLSLFGTIVGIVMIFQDIRKLSHIILVPNPRIESYKRLGMHISPNLISMDYLQLLKSLFVDSISAVVLLIFLLSLQILAFVWVSMESFSTMYLWTPIVLFGLVSASYICLVRNAPVVSLSCLTCFMVSSVLFMGKISHKMDISWLTVYIPVFFIQFAFLFRCVQSLWTFISHSTIPTSLDSIILTCYLLSTLLCACIEYMDINRGSFAFHSHLQRFDNNELSLWLWPLLSSVVALTMYLTIKRRCVGLLSSSGYDPPRLLWRTVSGWNIDSQSSLADKL